MVEKSINERVGILETTVASHEDTLVGRAGEKGLKQTVTDFMAVWASRETDKMKYDDQQNKKNNLLIAIGALLLTLVGLGWGVFVYERTNHTHLEFKTDTEVRTDARR